jgi:hypothetical protein
MKIIRSTKCSLRFITQKKREMLKNILKEYGRVVNVFIDRWWLSGCPKVKDLRAKDMRVESWFSARLINEAAREAVAMITAVRERYITAKKNKEKCKTTPKKPIHRCGRMCVSGNIALYQLSNVAGFDAWLHMQSIGEKIVFDIPIKRHKHFNYLAQIGRRNNSYTITQDYVQFSFEIETGKKLDPTGCVGLDSGINCLASVSTSQRIGEEIKDKIQRVRRCKHGSNGQKRARRALKHYIDKTVKDVLAIEDLTLLVVEQLDNITKDTTKRKRKLGRSMRYLLGSWNVSYWLKKLEMGCERNRVSFRTVPAYYTSVTCPICTHCQKGNRKGSVFKCLHCGYEGHADIVASNNILNLFLKSEYGDGCTRLLSKLSGTRCDQMNRSTSDQSDNTTFQ